MHKANGLDRRASGRARLRNLVYDNGYTMLDGCNEMCLREGFASVFRYPANYGLSDESVPPAGSKDQKLPGPKLIAGEWYCPAVPLNDFGHNLVRSSTAIEEDGGYKEFGRPPTQPPPRG